MMYDVIIIGSGPAGLAAAIYAQRAELNTIVIEKNPLSGGQIINTYEVDNYPGLPGISGFELAEKFRSHCDGLGATFITGDVTKFEVVDNVKRVTIDDRDVYEAKAVIIATGAGYRKLGVEGEAKLSGMGVSYCATCDGAFFRNKTTVVVGGGDVAVEDAIFLARLCKKVYVVHRRHEFRAAKSLCNRLMAMENVETIWDSVVDSIEGNEMVEGIYITNVNTKEQNYIETNGVFIAVGNIPISDVFKDVVETDKAGYIIAGEDCATSIPGVYAAGDIRTKALKQIITAAADGANAITAVERYLNEL